MLAASRSASAEQLLRNEPDVVRLHEVDNQDDVVAQRSVPPLVCGGCQWPPRSSHGVSVRAKDNFVQNRQAPALSDHDSRMGRMRAWCLNDSLLPAVTDSLVSFGFVDQEARWHVSLLSITRCSSAAS